MEQGYMFWGRGVLLSIFSTVLLPAAVSYGALQYTGVNLSGAEFGVSTGHTGTANLPGNYGSTYVYPDDPTQNISHTEVDYFIGKGMNTFRLPFRWERLQQSANAALNSSELARMTTFVNEATSKGANVILDPHNFERYYPSLTQNFQSTTAGLVGGTVANSKGVVVTNAMFADFWGKVADQFKNNPKVIFNLMNEPNSVNLNTLVGSENAAIAAIRATGATNLILVPGTSFTGGWTWTNGNGSFGASNATAMLNIVDSGNNFAFDVHQYLDSDGSGTHTTIGGKVNPSDAADDPDATQLGKDRLTAVTNWLIANGRKGFLGEFAVDNSMIGTGAGQIGDETLTNMLNYIQDPSGNGSTPWMGFTWWGGGPFWANNSNFHIDPVNGVDQADMTFLKNGGYLAGVPEPTSAMILGVFCLGLGLKRRSRAAA